MCTMWRKYKYLSYMFAENKVGIIISWVMMIFKDLVHFEFIANSTLLLLQKLRVWAGFPDSVVSYRATKTLKV